MPEKNAYRLALEVGDSSVKFVFLSSVKNKVSVYEWGTFDLLETGDAKKKEVEGILKKISSVVPRTNLEQINIGISGSSVCIRRISLDSVIGDNLLDAAKWKVSKQLPFGVNDAEFSVEEIEKDKKIKDKRHVNLVACKKDTFSFILNKSSIHLVPPSLITASTIAIGNMNQFLDIKEEETVGIVDFGKNKTSIVIVRNGEIRFAREVTLASADITNTLRHNFLDPKSGDELSYESAEEMKKEHGLIQAEKPETVTPAPEKLNVEETEKTKENVGKTPETEEKSKDQEEFDSSKYSSAILPVLNNWANDLELSFEFYKEHYNGKDVDRIILTGGGSLLKGLDSFLKKRFEIPVEKVRFWEEILKLGTDVKTEKFLTEFIPYATTFSLAFSPKTKLNLIPKPVGAAKIPTWVIRVGTMVAIGLVLLLITRGILIERQLKGLEGQEEILSHHLKTLSFVQESNQRVQTLENFIEEARNRRLDVASFMKEITIIIPGNIIMDRMVLSRDAGKLQMVGRVTGRAEDRAITLTEFEKSLNNSPFVKRAEIKARGGEIRSDQQIRMSEFEAVCKLVS